MIKKIAMLSSLLLSANYACAQSSFTVDLGDENVTFKDTPTSAALNQKIWNITLKDDELHRSVMRFHSLYFLGEIHCADSNLKEDEAYVLLSRDFNKLLAKQDVSEYQIANQYFNDLISVLRMNYEASGVEQNSRLCEKLYTYYTKTVIPMIPLTQEDIERLREIDLETEKH